MRLSDFYDLEGIGNDFTSKPDISIDWKGLLTAIVGGILLGLANGLIRLIQLPYRIITELFEALRSFLLDLITALFGVEGVIRESFVTAQADVVASGIAAFAVGVLVAGSVILIASWVVDTLVR